MNEITSTAGTAFITYNIRELSNYSQPKTTLSVQSNSKLSTVISALKAKFLLIQ